MSFRSFDLLNLVRDHGSELVLRRVATDGTYNPATGAVDGSLAQDIATLGYFFDFAVGLMRGEEISRGTSRCVLPVLTLTNEPTDKDLIIGLGKTYAIVSVSTLYNGGQAMCYICEVRE